MKRQLYVGKNKPSQSQMNSVKNDTSWFNEFKKPKGGFWTSTIKVVADYKITSEWIEYRQNSNWLIKEDENIYELEVAPNANVYTIKSKKDFENLKTNYSLDANTKSDINIDFEKLQSDGYSGLRVTRNTYTLLNGWDCESTLWFKWCFTNVQKIPKKDCEIY